MAGGFKSPLPLLGLSGPTTQGGKFSLLAPWIGGAGAPIGVNGGFRGFMAFWVGGAGTVVSVAPFTFFKSTRTSSWRRSSENP
ncbi:MAG: hypothetical protein V3W09_04345 [Nitrososphaerales archaeon]